MTHARWMLVPLLALFALGGCAAILDPVSGEASEQRRRWEAQRLDDYRFTVARSCFCTLESTQPMRVEVRDDRVVKVVAVRTGAELGTGAGFTVDQLFDWIEAAERDGTYLEVGYHPERGYPLEATIGTLANDAGVAYSLSDLEAVR